MTDPNCQGSSIRYARVEHDTPVSIAHKNFSSTFGHGRDRVLTSKPRQRGRAAGLTGSLSSIRRKI